jgi:hypothetical protein
MIRTATATMPLESDTDIALSEKLQALGTFMTRYGLSDGRTNRFRLVHRTLC